jgi:hypothetical protein
MPTGEEYLLRAKPREDGLESYRRLIQLQKQMIELSRKHEESKRECAALRNKVAREMASQSRTQWTLRHRMQYSAGRLLKRIPGFGSIEVKLALFNNKQVPSW